MITAGYFLALQAGLITQAPPEGLAVVWPASGVALAALLVYPRRAWGDVLGVISLTNLASQALRGYPIQTNLGFTLANTLEPLLAALLMARLAPRRITFTRFRDALALLAAASLSTGLSAALGAWVTLLGYGTPFWTSWKIWWVQDELSMLLLPPLILLWLTQPSAAGGDNRAEIMAPGFGVAGFSVPTFGALKFSGLNFSPARSIYGRLARLDVRRPLEGMAMLTAVAALSWLIYGRSGAQSFLRMRPYLLLLLLMWPALRFRPRGAITAAALAVVVAQISAAWAWQPVADGSSLVSHLATGQATLVGACASVLILTTLFYEREQALAALQDSQALLAQAESIARIGGWKLNLHDHRLHLSDEMYRLFSVTPGTERYLTDEAIARTVHPDDLGVVRYVLHQALETGQIQPVEFRLRLPDGGQRVIHGEGQSILGAGGELQGMIGYLQDVTVSKHMKETLSLSRDFYASLFHHSPVGTALVRLSDLLVEDANQEFASLLGYTQTDVVGRPLLTDALPPGRPGRQELIDLLSARRPIRDLEVSFLTKDGQPRQGLLFVDRIEKDGQAYLLLKCIDITARRQAEQQRQEMLKEKEFLLRELYHRTNNNMQIISALLDMQASQCAGDSDTGTDSRDPAGERLRLLLNDAQVRIRSMSLIHDRLYQSQNLASIDFGACLADLVDLVRQRYSGLAERLRFTVEAQPILLSIDLAAPCALVANELLTNAVKHGFPGRPDGQVSVRLWRVDGQTICLEIADDGVGLPPGLDPAQSTRMGLQTVFGITASQLHSRVELLPGPGVHWRIVFREK